MTKRNILNMIMGVTFEDLREPSIVHFSEACKCPVNAYTEDGTLIVI